MLERLQKVLAAAGVASRRDAEELIQSGRVQVDGRPVTELGTKVDPDEAAILVDGRPITPRPPRLYVALHKPPGFDTTRADPHAAHTVMELVVPGLEARFGRGSPSVQGLHPVGRLDRDSEGLLLLTNDGAFTQAMTHPRHGVTKTYVAEVGGQPSPEQLEQLRNGLEIDGRLTRPAHVRMRRASTGSRIVIVLREGRKRQVRRMLKAIGHPVHRLVRTAIGPVTLKGLDSGQYRLLSPQEVRALLDDAASEATKEPAPSALTRARRRGGKGPDQRASPRHPPAPPAEERPRRASASSPALGQRQPSEAPRDGKPPRRARRPQASP